MKQSSNKYFDTLDFYYDSYRPLLYWYVYKSKKLYELNKVNSYYNNPPGLLDALKRLDENYFQPENVEKIEPIEENIYNHLIIKNMSTKARPRRNRMYSIYYTIFLVFYYIIINTKGYTYT